VVFFSSQISTTQHIPDSIGTLTMVPSNTPSIAPTPRSSNHSLPTTPTGTGDFPTNSDVKLDPDTFLPSSPSSGVGLRLDPKLLLPLDQPVEIVVERTSNNQFVMRPSKSNIKISSSHTHSLDLRESSRNSFLDDDSLSEGRPLFNPFN